MNENCDAIMQTIRIFISLHIFYTMFFVCALFSFLSTLNMNYRAIYSWFYGQCLRLSTLSMKKRMDDRQKLGHQRVYSLAQPKNNNIVSVTKAKLNFQKKTRGLLSTKSERQTKLKFRKKKKRNLLRFVSTFFRNFCI